MASAGLSTSQFAVLDALLHLGPLCQKDLGEKILKTSGNMTMVIDNLEKGGSFSGSARLMTGDLSWCTCPMEVARSWSTFFPGMPRPFPGRWPSYPLLSKTNWDACARSWGCKLAVNPREGSIFFDLKFNVK